MDDSFARPNQPFEDSSAASQKGYNLGLRILKPRLSPDQTREFYIQSTPYAPASQIGELNFDLPSQIGSYELQILKNLLIQKPPILCLVGPKGSGKTTTIRYLMEILKNRETHPPIIGQIDFDEYKNLNRVPADALSSEILEILNTELVARLNSLQLLTTETEKYIDFWDFEINKYGQRSSSSPSFTRILRLLGSNSLHPLDASDTMGNLNRITERKELSNEILSKPPLAFDYLQRQWRYILSRTETESFFWLENLDRLPPYIQEEALRLISANALAEGGLTFVIPVRSEVFGQLETLLSDVELLFHQGPKLSDVVIDRISKACVNKNAYLDPHLHLDANQFNSLVNFCCLLNQLWESNNEQFIRDLENFIVLASGKSVRTALLLCCNLFGLDPKFLTQDQAINGVWLQATVSQSLEDIDLVRQSEIEHMYKISNYSHGSFLVKPRILQIINSQGEKRIKFDQIVESLGAFGYSRNQIYDGINDLTRIQYQLISSTSHDFFSLDIAENAYSEDILFLTELGENYLSKLMWHTDYVLESLNFINLFETHDIDGLFQEFEIEDKHNRYIRLLIFLNELLKKEQEQVKLFIESRGLEAYFEIHGPSLVTENMYVELTSKIKNILHNEISDYRLRQVFLNELERLSSSCSILTRRLLGIRI